MIKIFKYLLAVVMTFAAVACVKEKIEEKPVINLSTTSLTIPSDGRSQKIVYEVSGVSEVGSVTVSANAEWLTVNASKARLIEVSATKNDTGAMRSADFTVSYPGAEDVVVKINQPSWQEPIILTVHGTESTAIVFSVVTENDDIAWVGQVVGQEWFNEMGSDEKIFQEDMTYYQNEAYDKGMSLQDYLKTIMNKGTHENLQYKGLDPSSDYVVYVYGITEEGERTTDIYSAQATTQPPYTGPITFGIEVTEENSVMDITVTPDHDGVYYYWNIMDRDTYDSYAAVHGDDPVAVFQAYVDWDIQDLIDYEYLTSRSEYYEWYSDINAVNSQFECVAMTEYIIFACKWDEDCRFTGEPSYIWHTSADVPLSDNVITVTIGDDVDQSSFFVDVRTTNNDPYVMIAEPSVFMDGMDDTQIYAHLMEDYGTWGLLSYMYEGNIAGRMIGLEPDTEYTMVVFGYKAGKQTTPMQKFTVRTAPAGPAEDCTFDFVLNEAGANTLNITVTPSDAAHFYYWYVYKMDQTADDVRNDIRDMINNSYYGDMYEFSYYELSQGESTGEISFLAPETEYRVAAVVMDEDTGEFLADVIFSEPFSTTEAVYADITITATFDKFYNGDDLYDINPDAGAQYRGYAMVPVSITIDGEYSSYYYTMFEYETGLENPDLYPDAMLYQTLVYYGVNYAEKVNFRAPWNKAVMIAAMAIDKEGRYSRVYRQKVTFKKHQAADIEELFSRATQSAPVKCVKTMQPAKNKVEKNPVFGKEALRERKMDVKQNNCVFRSLI
ncbi:MAG: BACON domain-containing protein [Bacteroidales bacterium]|nr:BACON domain-containing protein [Bacteroidales bacterium]